jgi:putative oxidoreductase
MKIIVIITRVVLGLLFMVSAVSYFFNLMPAQPMGEKAQLFVTGLMASGYLMPVVKVIETVCAISFLSNRFIPIAKVIIFPITVNILLFHAFMAPAGVFIPLLIFAGNIFLAYVYRRNYDLMLSARG